MSESGGGGGGIQCQSSSSSSCSNSQPQQLKFYQAFTFATPIIFTLVLLLLFCVLYVRRRQTARAVSQLRAQFFARGLFSAWPMDHGLTKSFRDALPIVVFDEEFAASREDNQCAVCLSDYQLGEKLQQLPLCDHVFHVECIDEWLASNATCPICRTSLLQPGKLVPLDSLAVVATQSGQSTIGNTTTSSTTSVVPIPEAAATTTAPECSTSGTIELKVVDSSASNSAGSSKAAVVDGASSSMENAVKDGAVEHVIHIER